MIHKSGDLLFFALSVRCGYTRDYAVGSMLSGERMAEHDLTEGVRIPFWAAPPLESVSALDLPTSVVTTREFSDSLFIGRASFEGSQVASVTKKNARLWGLAWYPVYIARLPDRFAKVTLSLAIKSLLKYQKIHNP
jgi:hypothetical protein